jgi:hypothetical protein
MNHALFGLLGVLLGLLISEYFRRRNRVENYAHEVFQKRLKIYEEYYSILNQVREIATSVMEEPSLTKEERKDIWSHAVHTVAKFNDQNELYINEEISFHFFMTIMNIENIYYISDEHEKEESIQNFRDNCRKLLKMIKEESGLNEIEKHYSSITKAKHQSEYIGLYRKMKKQYLKEGVIE